MEPAGFRSPTLGGIAMYYFALLRSKPRDLTDDEAGREMAAYIDFHSREAAAIREGDALGSRRQGDAPPTRHERGRAARHHLEQRPREQAERRADRRLVHGICCRKLTT